MIKLDSNMFKRYFSLMNDTLKTKLIGKDGKYHNAFYICDEDSYYSGDKSKRNVSINDQMKLLLPTIVNDNNEYMVVKFVLNCKELFNDDNYVYFFEPNFTLLEHTYHTTNYISTLLEKVDDEVLKNEVNKNILKKLSKEIDDYNEWLYFYKKNTYFNKNYEVIYRPSINKRINKYAMYELLKSIYKSKGARILFYSYINEDRIENTIRLDNYKHFEKCFSLFADKDGIDSQYGRSFDEAYKVNSIVKNKNNNEIRILYSLDDKYKSNYSYIDNINQTVVAEMIIYNNEKLHNHLINIK